MADSALALELAHWEAKTSAATRRCAGRATDIISSEKPVPSAMVASRAKKVIVCDIESRPRSAIVM